MQFISGSYYLATKRNLFYFLQLHIYHFLRTYHQKEPVSCYFSTVNVTVLFRRADGRSQRTTESTSSWLTLLFIPEDFKLELCLFVFVPKNKVMTKHSVGAL